jgi:hypothetical protein
MRTLVIGSLAAVILASGAGRANALLIVESKFPVAVQPSILAVPVGGFTSPVGFAGGTIIISNDDSVPVNFQLSFDINAESLPSQRVGSVTTFLTGPLTIGAAPPGGGPLSRDIRSASRSTRRR